MTTNNDDNEMLQHTTAGDPGTVRSIAQSITTGAASPYAEVTA